MSRAVYAWHVEKWLMKVSKRSSMTEQLFCAGSGTPATVNQCWQLVMQYLKVCTIHSIWQVLASNWPLLIYPWLCYSRIILLSFFTLAEQSLISTVAMCMGFSQVNKEKNGKSPSCQSSRRCDRYSWVWGNYSISGNFDELDASVTSDGVWVLKMTISTKMSLMSSKHAGLHIRKLHSLMVVSNLHRNQLQKC